MSNMSYCRFQNTAADLADCLEAQEGFTAALDELDEEGDEVAQGDLPLSPAERMAYIDLLGYARQLLDRADPDHLNEAGVSA